MKKIYFLLIALLCSATMSFAYETEIDGIYYNLNSENKTAEVTYTYDSKYSGNITIPEKVIYGVEYNVTSIGYNAFSFCSSLTSVSIPNSVIEIGRDAFSYCSSLTSIIIPNSVTSIGYRAFFGCSSLASVAIGNSVTEIGGSAFSDCSSLTSVSIPNSVTSIGGSAFSECSSLISITIPNSVTSIGGSAFSGCSFLTSIEIPNSVAEIGDRAFYRCSSLDAVYISDIVAWCNIDFSSESNPLSMVKKMYLNGELVTSLVIPEGVDTIKRYAFDGCSFLTSVTIPNSVTSIESLAFTNCTSLDSIVVESNTPPSLSDVVFNEEDIYFYIPDGTLSAYQKAWGSDYIFINNETSMTINVETPGTLSDLIFDAGSRPAYVAQLVVTGTLNSADFICMRENMTSLVDVDLSGITNTSGVDFNGQSRLRRIVLPKNLTSLGYNSYREKGVFEGCSSLKSIIIPEGVTTIGYSAFSGCYKLFSVKIPNTVTSIGDYCFSNCSFKSIVIPNNVKTIGSKVFSWCNSLESVTIGASVTSIGEKAFYNSSPDTIICLGMTPPSASNLECPATTCKLIVPTDAYKDYLRHSYWGQFLTILNTKVTTLVNNTEWGTVTGSGYYIEKDNVNLTATPKAGCHFVKWSDGNTENPRSFVVTQDSTFTAEFAINRYTITVSESENGIVTGMGEYNHGDTITLTATPNEHYYFAQWSDGNTENPRNIVVEDNIYLGVIFELNQYEISVVAQDSIMGQVYGSGTYDYGTEVTIEAIANEGYHFVKWSDGNTENPRTIVVTEDVELMAEFAINQYEVEVKSDENGYATGSGTYDYGTEVTIEAIANEGYHFVEWSDGNSENPRTIVVTEDVELMAEFEEDDKTMDDNVDESSVIVYVQDGVFYIEGADADYNVFDASGRLIYSGRDAQLSLPRGVYVIVVGGEVEKVVI
ncbi:MAG: leucine-rich repeat protein [Paludibacteraceae bacterium]|nr:leucine-rich repeat protein [Paludibacteraceae bacterium]